MQPNEEMWKFLQDQLGYTDEELALFRSKPENQRVMEAMPGMMGKTMVVEVIEARGCLSQHKKGDKFYMDMSGSLITKKCPKRMCVFALSTIAPAALALQELAYAGVDPNQMIFRTFGCPDTGVACGGWGHVRMRLSVADRSEA